MKKSIQTDQSALQVLWKDVSSRRSEHNFKQLKSKITHHPNSAATHTDVFIPFFAVFPPCVFWGGAVMVRQKSVHVSPTPDISGVEKIGPGTNQQSLK